MVFSKLGRSEANARSEIPKVGNDCFDMTRRMKLLSN